MVCKIMTVNDEVRNFTSSFFHGGSFHHPGTNSEICVQSTDENGINGILQFRLNRVNNVSSIVFVCVKKDAPYRTYNYLLETYLEYLRSEGIFSFYSHMTLDTAKKHWLLEDENLMKKRSRMYPAITDWNIYLHKILDPNEIATSELIQRFTLGMRVYNHPIVILKHELKNEFRNIRSSETHTI